jgi:hypothetical protein
MNGTQSDGDCRTSFSLMERAVAADNKSPPIDDDTSTHGASLHGENAARRQVRLMICTLPGHATHVTDLLLLLTTTVWLCLCIL